MLTHPTRSDYYRAMLHTAMAAAVLLVSSSAQGQSNPPPGNDPATAPQDSGGAESAATRDGLIATRSLLGVIRDGGVMMIPILACSFVLVVFVFERFISLRRGRVVPRPFVKRFLHRLREGQLDRDEALAVCEENSSPVAAVFAAAVKKWGRPAVEVEQAVLDSGERAANGLRQHLRVLNAISTVSPLLGLLGTVFGMIQCFNVIATAHAMGRPELLASGISEALLTTAAGLSVAVPALTAYWFFASRADRLIIEIDALGQEVVEVISAEGLQEQSRPRASRVRRQESAA